MVKVSILIPLYNGVEFLAECIDSVIQQTFMDWEVLIGINEHGDDGGDTAEIARQIASKDDRIKITIQN
jgi:glycosyltransferase involved in cell wall biosynthesis